VERAVWTLLATCACAGCGAITGVDSLQEVPACEACDGALPLDAAMDAGLLDAPALDASTLDAGGDTGPGPSVDAPAESAHDAGFRWCASLSSPPTFCDDFDVGPLGASWDGQSVTLGSLSLVPKPVVSSPNALLSSTLATAIGMPEAELNKSFTTILTASRFVFSLYVGTVDKTVPYPKFAALSVNNANWALYLQLSLGTTPDLVEQVPVDGGVAFLNYNLSQPIPAGAWSVVEIDTSANARGGVGSFSVTINGASALPTTSVSTSVLGTPTIHVGLFGITPPSSAWAAYYDDVAFYL
jgi:hypothetical protein